MKAAVTGITGALGRYILPQLSQEYEHVYCFVRSPDKFQEMFADESYENVSLVEGDLTNYSDLEQLFEQDFDHLFHMAAKVSALPKDIQQGFVQTNITATQHLLELSESKGIEKFIYTSSYFALGETPAELVNETHNHPPNYHHPYIVTKYDAGKIVDSFQNSSYEKITVNPTTVIGIGLNDVVTTLIVEYLNNTLIGIPHGGKNRMNFVTSESVARGHILAAKHGRDGEKYLLGGENMSYREFLAIFGDPLGLSAPRSIPPWLILPYVWILEKLFSSPKYTMGDFQTSTRQFVYDTSKAQRELDYQPDPINFETVGKPLIQWFIDRNLLKKKVADRLISLL